MTRWWCTWFRIGRRGPPCRMSAWVRCAAVRREGAVADFRVDAGVFTHIKTKRLRRALGAEGVEALFRLWAYAAGCKHGADKAYTDEDVELAGCVTQSAARCRI